MCSPYPGCHKVQSALSEFLQSLDKGRMRWYNIIGDNKGIISHILRLDTITARSILLTANLIAPKRENSDTFLIVKGTEWMKFIDSFGLIIETNLSKVGILNVHVFRIEYIPRNSSINPHIESQQLQKQFNLDHQSYGCTN